SDAHPSGAPATRSPTAWARHLCEAWSMTSANPNLELVRSIYADWQRGDFTSNEWADAEIEFAFAGGPHPESWTGLAGMAQGYRDWLRAWKDLRAEPEEYVVIDDERLLVLVRHGAS